MFAAILLLLALPVMSITIVDEVAAQAVSVDVSLVDMYGGAVLPRESDVGVAFGTRVGLASVFGGIFAAGVELDWWTAERRARNLEVRDIVGGIAVWRELGLGKGLRSFVGVGTGIHSVDASRADGTRFVEGESLVADRLRGYRIGASGFAGFSIRLTRTGNIWLMAEYRYTAVRRVAHHELRAGLRLLFTQR